LRILILVRGDIEGRLCQKSNLTVKAQYQQEKKDKDRKKRERKQNSELLETGFVKARTDFKIKKIK